MKKYPIFFTRIAGRLGIGAGLLALSDIAVAGSVGTVPEPGPLGLLVLGGVALAIAKRILRNK